MHKLQSYTPNVPASGRSSVTVKTAHGYLQLAKAGKLHRVFEEIVDDANAISAHCAQFVLLGTRAVVLATPEAVQSVLKSGSFLPKLREAYHIFHWLVRVLSC